MIEYSNADELMVSDFNLPFFLRCVLLLITLLLIIGMLQYAAYCYMLHKTARHAANIMSISALEHRIYHMKHNNVH